MTMDEHPAMIAARDSWAAVQAGDKDAWLALMADDVVIEDPIGEAPTNPTGLGARGRSEVGEFFDTNIGPNRIAIDVHTSRVAGNESAHHMTLTTTLADGTKAVVTGLFAYRVNEDGLLASLRGWWGMDDMTFVAPGTEADETGS
ncbi:MAG: nuclear transport factor 2 family protein [Acidimicrobiia bacterium]